MNDPNARGYPRHVQMKRLGCCAGWPKPCSYHEGYADAYELVAEYEDVMRAGLRWKAVAEDLGGLGYEFRCAASDCDRFAVTADIGDAGDIYLCPDHSPSEGTDE